MTLRCASELLLPRTYEDVWYRGEAYLDRGLVKILSHDDKSVRALVKGSDEYVVTMSISGSSLARRCSCPYARGGTARSPGCKHQSAVALAWDIARRFSAPTREDIETKSMPPPLVSIFDIERARGNPLSANLEVLRLAASEGSAWVKPHARLPLAPDFERDLGRALSLDDFKQAHRTMLRWTRLPLFDPYFCAGEMIAANCEIIRAGTLRVPASSALSSALALLEAVKFHEKLLDGLIDDSDNFREFSEAHLEAFSDAVKKIKPVPTEKAYFDTTLWNYERVREKLS